MSFCQAHIERAAIDGFIHGGRAPVGCGPVFGHLHLIEIDDGHLIVTVSGVHGLYESSTHKDEEAITHGDHLPDIPPTA